MAHYARFLQFPLCLCGVFMLIYGIGFLASPEFVWAMSGEPLLGEVGLFRWFGAVMIGVGIACLSTGENPQRQLPVLNQVSAGGGLAFLALTYNWVAGEYRGDPWFILIPLVVFGVLTPVFWWGQTRLGGLISEEERKIERRVGLADRRANYRPGATQRRLGN